MKFKNISGLLIAATITASVLGCSHSSSGSHNSTTNSTVVIDSMTTVPVVNGSATTGALYIHNYTDHAISSLAFNVGTSGYKLNHGVLSKVKSVFTGKRANINSGYVITYQTLIKSTLHKYNTI